MGKHLIYKRFEALSHALRVLMESNLRFGTLMGIDLDEAIGNMETGFETVLEALHSLYDAMEKELKERFNWYSSPETCTILALRNAKHHNLSNGIQSLFKYHVQHSTAPKEPLRYLLFPYSTDNINVKYYISLGDISNLISLPSGKSHLRPEAIELIKNYLNVSSLEEYANRKSLKNDRIFIDAIPLVINTGRKVYPYIEKFLKDSSFRESAEVQGIRSAFSERGQIEAVINKKQIIRWSF
jgi:hypothetical protein